MTWVLIFSLYVTRAGGPAAATFGSELACEKAALAIQHKWPNNYMGHVCVPFDQK